MGTVATGDSALAVVNSKSGSAALGLEFGDAVAFGQWYDFEAIVNDFTLLCCIVGNDFLPHLPFLAISDGGLQILLNGHKTYLRK